MTETTPKPILDLVVIDCPDPLELAQFYATVLGWDIEEGADDHWVNVVHPEGAVSQTNPGGRTALAFQRIPDYVAPTWPGGEHPQQFHLDLACVDIEAAEPALLAAGGRVHDHQPSENGGFKVYLDPAGHPLCLVK